MGDYLRKKDREEISMSKVIQPRVIELQATARVTLTARETAVACRTSNREQLAGRLRCPPSDRCLGLSRLKTLVDLL
jgi:hypothetical protein